MNALKLRDDLFSELHAEVLKPAGFRKKGRWSIRECDEVAHSFFLRTSRFSREDDASFWIDVQVFSEQVHQLLFSPAPYKGPAEGTQCLVMLGLPEWSWPSKGMDIRAEGDKEHVKPRLFQSAAELALPFLDACDSHSAVLETLLREEKAPLEIAALHHLLGNEEQARAYMEKAKSAAKFENELRFLQMREAKMWPPRVS